MNIEDENYFFGNILQAALELGDLDFMLADLEWISKLLPGRRISAAKVDPYLVAYRRCLSSQIGEASAPITAWVGSYLARQEV